MLIISFIIVGFVISFCLIVSFKHSTFDSIICKEDQSIRINDSNFKVNIFNEHNGVVLNSTQYLIFQNKYIIPKYLIPDGTLYKIIKSKCDYASWIFDPFVNNNIFIPTNSLCYNKLIIDELKLRVVNSSGIVSENIILSALNCGVYVNNIVESIKTNINNGKFNFIIPCKDNDISFNLMVSMQPELLFLQKYIDSYQYIDTLFKETKIINNSDSMCFIFNRHSKILLNSQVFVNSFLTKNVKYLEGECDDE